MDAGEDGERPPAAYLSARDAWLGAHAPGLVGREPQHTCSVATFHTLSDPHGSIGFEELDGRGALCGAWAEGGEHHAFGTPEAVLTAMADMSDAGAWVAAVVDALDTDRAWPSRRTRLDVALGAGQLGHVSASSNRDSIRQHGLDWTRMASAGGVAGSRSPELPAVFLDDISNIGFFIRMARVPVDVWAVDVSGLWIENGPNGWYVHTKPIRPERVHLLMADLPPQQ